MGNTITVEQDDFLKYLCSGDKRLPANLAARTDMFVKGYVASSCMVGISESDIDNNRALTKVIMDSSQQAGILAASDLPPSPALVRSILSLESAGSPKLHEVMEGCLLLVEESTKASIRTTTDAAVPPTLLPIVTPVALAFSRIVLATVIRDTGNNAAMKGTSETLVSALARRFWLNTNDVSAVNLFGREERMPMSDDRWDRPHTIPTTHNTVSVVPRLIDACAQYITRIKLDKTTVQTHIACTKLLLTCMTTALYHDPRFSYSTTDVFTEYILAQDYLRTLVVSLLQRLGDDVEIDYGLIVCIPIASRTNSSGKASQPPSSQAASSGGWLSWLGGSSQTDPISPLSANTDMCSEQPFEATTVNYGAHLTSLSILLIQQLVYHQRQNGHNAAQEVIRTLEPTVPLSLRALSRSISDNWENGAGLFYTLVVDNPRFLGIVLKNGDPSMLISQLLCTVASAGSIGDTKSKSHGGGEGWMSWLGYGGYPPPQTNQVITTNPHRSIVDLTNKLKFHLASTIILVLSQDMTINSNLWSGKWAFAGSQGVVPWLPPGHQSGSCLGTHWILLVCKAISKSIIMRWFDAAVTLTAAIQNAAPFFHHLEAHASQRLAHLLSSTVKRLCRLCTLVAAERLRKEATAPGTTIGPDNHLATEEIATLVHVVCGVAEGIVGAITVSDRRNYSLFYELLYNKPILRLEPIQPAPKSLEDGDTLAPFLPKVTTNMINDVAGEHKYSVLEALSPIQDVMEQVDSELASVSVNHTPNAILDLIKHVVESEAVLVSRMPTTSANASMGSIPAAMEGSALSRSPSMSTSRNPRQTLPNCLEVAYVYEEGSDCNGFFTPMVWAQQFGAMFEWDEVMYSYGQVGAHAYGDPCTLPLFRPLERLPIP